MMSKQNSKLNSKKYKEQFDVEDNIIMSKSQNYYRTFLTSVESREFSVHEAIEFILVISGEFKITVRNKSYDVKSGEIFIINSNYSHILERNDENNEENLVLCFQIEPNYLKKKFLNNEDVIFYNSFTDKNIKENIILSLGLLFIEGLSSKPNKEKEYKYLEFLMKNLNENILLKDSDKFKYQEVDKSVNSIVLEIAEDYTYNMGEDPSLEYLSKKYDLSPSYLSRMFKKVVGMNLTEYYRRRKVSRAIGYLINSDYTISQISNRSGFKDIKAMNRDFHKEIGMSATKFRKEISSYLEVKRLEDKSSEEVKRFIEQIDSLWEKKKYLLNGPISKKYIIDTSLINKEYTQALGETTINLEGLIQNNLLNLDETLKNIPKTTLIVNIKISKDKFMLKISDKKYREISLVEYIYILTLVKKYDIKPVIRLDIYKLLEDLLYMESNKGNLNIYYENTIENIRLILKNVADLKLNQWKIELDISNIKERKKIEFLKRLIRRIREDVGSISDGLIDINKENFGIYIGNIKTEEDIDEKFKKILEMPEILGFYSINFIYDHKKDAQNESLNKFLKKLENKFNYDILKKSKLFINIKYKISENLNWMGKYKKLYFYKLYLDLILVRNEENDFVTTFNMLDLNHANREMYNFYNNIGIIQSSYYLLNFLNEFKGNTILNKSGIFSMNIGKSNLSTIIYSKPEELYDFLRSEQNNQIKTNNRVTELNFTNLNGLYKVTEYRIDYDTLFFAEDWLSQLGLKRLNNEEKKYLEKKSIPSMNVYYKRIDGNLSYKMNHSILDIIYLKIEKVVD